jgi:decaprenylphospho-beta-D-erythro-pentofuranosid-2-ulose 2-reductase
MKDALGGVQTVLVLGGASELALASVAALDLRPGATVVLAGRDEAALEKAGAGLSAQVVVRRWDATDVDRHAAFLAEVTQQVGDLDLVLVAAGVLGDQEQAERDPSYAAQVLNVNFTGLAAAMVAVADRLRGQGHGTIVVFSSVAGLRGRRANFVYGSSKAGLDAFAEGLSAALHGSGVRVITVRPGFVHGRMTAGRDAAPFATDPATVGSAVAAAVRARRDVVYVPPVLQPVFAVMRALPRAVFRKLPG